MSLFLAADACLSWSLPSITEQQVSPHRLPMQYWLKNHRLSSNTPSPTTVFLIQQSCVMIELQGFLQSITKFSTEVQGFLWRIDTLVWPIKSQHLLQPGSKITCSQYSQECPPFQDAPFPTSPEGLQSVCKLSFRVFNRWTTNLNKNDVTVS